MRSALLLTGMIIAEALFSFNYVNSADNPQSRIISIVLSIFIVIFLAMDIYELFNKYNK